MTTTDANAVTRSRTFTWSDPKIGARAAQSMSGLEYLRAMAGGEVPSAPLGATLGMSAESVEEGHVVFALDPAEYHYNPIGMVHGGVAAALLDSAMSCAIHTTLPAGTNYSTLEIKVNYVRAMTAETGRVRCEGTMIHVGGRTATAEGRVLDEAGRLYAHGTATCIILRPAASGEAP